MPARSLLTKSTQSVIITARTEVLIDNAADVSIVHPSLLQNIMPAERAIKINGVGGHQYSIICSS